MSKSSPKVLLFASHNSFEMVGDTINIHLGQLGVSSPVIPGLFPDGFQIEVKIENGTPTLVNQGKFPLIMFRNLVEGSMETNVITQGSSAELVLEENSRFAVTVFKPSGDPLTLDIRLKVSSVINTNGYNYVLYINPRNA